MILALTLFIILSFALFQYKAYHKNIDMIDVFIAMSTLYFGVWPIIVIGWNPEPYQADSFLIILSTSIVSLSLFFLWLINIAFSDTIKLKGYKRFISLDGFFNIATNISVFKIYLLVLSLILFMTYSYMAFGITRAFYFDDLAREGIVLPSWYLVIYSSIRFLIIVSVMLASVKLVSHRKKIRASLIFLFALTILLSMLFGRASILMAIFSFVFIFIKIHRVHFFQFKTLKVVLFIVALAYVSTNVFQHMRSALLSPTSYANERSASAVFNQRFNTLTVESLLSPDELVESLNERPSVWKFNVMILDWQFNQAKFVNIPYGELLFSSWAMLIPRVIWEDKPPNNLQEYYLFPMYNQSYVVFQASSLIGYVIADFGLFAILIFPVMVLLLILLTLIMARIFSSLSAAYILFSVSLMFNVMNVETNYDSYIMIFRSAFFFALCLLALHMLKKLLPRRTIRKGNKRISSCQRQFGQLSKAPGNKFMMEV